MDHLIAARRRGSHRGLSGGGGGRRRVKLGIKLRCERGETTGDGPEPLIVRRGRLRGDMRPIVRAVMSVAMACTVAVTGESAPIIVLTMPRRAEISAAWASMAAESSKLLTSCWRCWRTPVMIKAAHVRCHGCRNIA